MAIKGISERVAAFLAASEGQLAGEMRSDTYTRVIYSTDASLYQLMPHAVFYPRDADDIAGAVSLAAEWSIPVLARAAGTSLAGQAVNEALVIDVSRHLDQIVAVNPDECWARVQPGVVLDELNAALRPQGLQFGPDPASGNRSTIGGAVANNATGSHSLLYGMTADHVRGMKIVLSDGSKAIFGEGSTAGVGDTEIRIEKELTQLVGNAANLSVIRDGIPRYWRRCGGYNLDRLVAGGVGNLSPIICGSEGTLAVMTEITVNLVPLAEHTALALLHFDSLDTALAAVPDILETAPTAVELLDTLSLTLCRDVPEYARLLASVVEGRPNCLLVVEYQGESMAAVKAAVERLEALAKRRSLGAIAITRALTVAAQAAVWRVRKVGLGLLMSLKGDVKPIPFIEDAAVPVEHLAAYVRQIEEYCGGLGTPITYYAHAGAGCLHIRPVVNRRIAAEIARLPDIAQFAAGLVKGYDGALSSEHGDGRTRSWLNEAFYGPELYRLFREVKSIFDPDDLFNPGIIVDASPMTDSMRALAQPVVTPQTNFEDFDANDTVGLRIANKDNTKPAQSLARAVEMCNGAGVCRQKITGTMCPSFMVTRDEEHSTRGRANALRAAMSGVLPVTDLVSPRMYQVMDLCISCKACKAECPSAVDMARLKTEFLAQYYATHGIPLRARFFAHGTALNRLGSGWRAPLVNAILQSSGGRGLVHRVLGLAHQRPLPRIATESFATWWRRRGKLPEAADQRGEIVLLIDPYTNFNHPEVGVAAVEFLEAIGIRVTLAVSIDDGRAAISKGLASAARLAAERTLEALASVVEQEYPLVGLEPSSLLTLRDEYFHLVPGDSRVKTIAENSMTFEEYVAGLATTTDLSGYFRQDSRRVLLHGHCHQKSLVGMEPSNVALSLPPGYTVAEIDSGCCGMAGSFGYEAEHYAISMQMAERRLLPAVRAADAETIIVAAGVSCREQIAHGSGRTAYHPAQVLRDALAG